MRAGIAEIGVIWIGVSILFMIWWANLPRGDDDDVE